MKEDDDGCQQRLPTLEDTIGPKMAGSLTLNAIPCQLSYKADRNASFTAIRRVYVCRMRAYLVQWDLADNARPILIAPQ